MREVVVHSGNGLGEIARTTPRLAALLLSTRDRLVPSRVRETQHEDGMGSEEFVEIRILRTRRSCLPVLSDVGAKDGPIFIRAVKAYPDPVTRVRRGFLSASAPRTLEGEVDPNRNGLASARGRDIRLPKPGPGRGTPKSEAQAERVEDHRLSVTVLGNQHGDVVEGHAETADPAEVFDLDVFETHGAPVVKGSLTDAHTLR